MNVMALHQAAHLRHVLERFEINRAKSVRTQLVDNMDNLFGEVALSKAGQERSR